MSSQDQAHTGGYGCEQIEVDAIEMSAMIVDIVFPPHFAIGWNVDTASHLILDDFRSRFDKQGFSLISGIGESFQITGCGTSSRHVLITFSSVKPVDYRDIMRLWKSAKASGFDLCHGERKGLSDEFTRSGAHWRLRV